jgi:catechol O-methyltransferase
VYSVELAAANAVNARRIWEHAGVADRITCVVGTVGDGGKTLDTLAAEHGPIRVVHREAVSQHDG